MSAKKRPRPYPPLRPVARQRDGYNPTTELAWFNGWAEDCEVVAAEREIAWNAFIQGSRWAAYNQK